MNIKMAIFASIAIFSANLWASPAASENKEAEKITVKGELKNADGEVVTTFQLPLYQEGSSVVQVTRKVPYLASVTLDKELNVLNSKPGVFEEGIRMDFDIHKSTQDALLLNMKTTLSFIEKDSAITLSEKCTSDCTISLPAQTQTLRLIDLKKNNEVSTMVMSNTGTPWLLNLTWVK